MCIAVLGEAGILRMIGIVGTAERGNRVTVQPAMPNMSHRSSVPLLEDTLESMVMNACDNTLTGVVEGENAV